MEHAKTIAMAEDLLADGRAEDVVRMIDPLLDTVDAPAADTGQLLLRALRARIAVAHHHAPEQTLDLLPSPSDVAELCTCVRAEVTLWRGWAHAHRNQEPAEVPRALRLLREAQLLNESVHSPTGRCWSLLGRGLAFFSVGEYALLDRTLDEAAPLVDALDDAQGRYWLHVLRTPAHRAANRLAKAHEHVGALRALGRQRRDPELQGLAAAYDALLRLDDAPSPDTALDRAASATAHLQRASETPETSLLTAYKAYVGALLRSGRPDDAAEVATQAERTLPSHPGPQAAVSLLRAQIALDQDDLERADSLLTPLLDAASPLPRGFSHAHLHRLWGTLHARQAPSEKSGDAWLLRAERTARETGNHAEAKRARHALAEEDGEKLASVTAGERNYFPESSGEMAPPIDGLVAESEAMRDVLDQLRRAQPSRCPLLFVGEKGVGKHALARAVHETGPRADGPLEHVTAADMQHHPTENRLFGSVDEADTLSPGAVQAADGGTLVIEDVEALSLSAQSSLLHLLNTGTVCPEGSGEAMSVDVRLIATTTADLDERIRNGHFRPTLRDWLSILPVEVPPLRERRADIPLLVRRFLNALRSSGTAAAAVTQPAMEALLRYDWPGNVRQLRNEIERALVHVSSEPTPTLDLDVLLAPIVEGAQANAPTPDANDADAILHPNQSLDDVLSRTEKTVIERVLRACDGQVTASAEVLGLTRQGLYKKMKRLGIDASSFQPSADPAPAAS